MDYINNFLAAFKSMGIIGYIILVVLVVYLIVAVFYMKKAKNQQEKWLSENPGASKVYLRSSVGIITSNNIRGYVVSGEAYPGIAYEKGKPVLYGIGDIEVELTYTYTRPGVLHKRVTYTWGPTKVSLALEKGKNYSLSFDKKEETFTLTEE